MKKNPPLAIPLFCFAVLTGCYRDFSPVKPGDISFLSPVPGKVLIGGSCRVATRADNQGSITFYFADI
jgi:hypothetical protein